MSDNLETALSQCKDAPRGNVLVTPDQVRDRVRKIFHTINVSLIEWSDIGNDLLGAATRIEELERELAESKNQIAKVHKDFGFELQDPNGTIWDHAAEIQKQRDEARIAYAVVVDAMVVEQSAHRNTRNQRDKLAALLKMIRDHYSEWKIHPECDCDECLLLGPIDNTLATLELKSNERAF